VTIPDVVDPTVAPTAPLRASLGDRLRVKGPAYPADVLCATCRMVRGAPPPGNVAPEGWRKVADGWQCQRCQHG
jgi:hypothetical protein